MDKSFHLSEISNKILETSIDGFILLDTSGVIFKANDAYCNMLGYSEQELIGIKSPMVGTFFSAQSPDIDSYVTVVAGVSEDTVVCIIEAMKVMNEIKAECTGTIAEVCVKNAQPVEFGQVLFKVKPA